MTKKGQKMQKYSYEEKIKIVKEYYKIGGSTYSISSKYGIPRTTVKSWIESYRTNGDVPKLTAGDDKSNGKHILSLKDYKERYEILKKYHAFLKAQRERK